MSRTTWHRGECHLCDTSSPRFATDGEARRWIEQHRGRCSRTTRAHPVKREPVDWGEVDELVARARALKPIDPSMNGSAHVRKGGPRRVDLDNWGRSLGGGVRWTGANCLRASIATLLGAANLERVPAGWSRDW